MRNPDAFGDEKGNLTDRRLMKGDILASAHILVKAAANDSPNVAMFALTELFTSRSSPFRANSKAVESNSHNLGT